MKFSIQIFLTVLLLFAFAQNNTAQKRTDANLIGHVVCEGEHLPFVSLIIEGTTIGTTTDETGHFQMLNLPIGDFTVKTHMMGYESETMNVTTEAGHTKELKFELKPDAIGLNEVVITGDRNEKNRKESSVIVTTLTPKLFKATQSITLGESLNYCSGLRMENNCQNCGFSQVRINGLEGAYSQILINSRPIFSGLAGVYGLELIPTTMIERVEVVRGGGSALYGSNAIAGTINLILKDPISNIYEIGISNGWVGTGLDGSGPPANDFSLNANTSLVSNDSKTGLSLYGFYRDREPFDANNDGFSEITTINNTTFGSRFYHRIGIRSKIMADIFTINEDRRGGDKFDSPEHEANIAESVKHRILTGALTYEQFVGDLDLLSVFVSAQKVKRNSYYGANKSLKDYGLTDNLTFSAGGQYTAKIQKSTLIAGVEIRGDYLEDYKLGYPDLDNAIIEDGEIVSVPHVGNITIADQTSITKGVYFQYEYNLLRWQFSAGARLENYSISDNGENVADNSGNVLSPRLSVKYDLAKNLQLRTSFSQGYRAPQVFDEDLHIETSGSRRVIHRNDPNLKQETSHSFMLSADYTVSLNTKQLNLLAEGFYTLLQDPFVNEFGTPDENGQVIYTRINADRGAVVQGVNLELNFATTKDLTTSAGFTIQSSRYEDSQEFDEKSFLRTPNTYGFLTFDWPLTKKLGVSATGNYTGSMLIPYFGTQLENPDVGELRTSQSFYDAGLKVRYTVRLNGAKLRVFAGVKNIFNAYQDDFDYGIDRDPGYVYGPMESRTFYVGLKIGNLL